MALGPRALITMQPEPRAGQGNRRRRANWATINLMRALLPAMRGSNTLPVALGG
jgi:hypothetical protein